MGKREIANPSHQASKSGEADPWPPVGRCRGQSPHGDSGGERPRFLESRGPGGRDLFLCELEGMVYRGHRCPFWLFWLKNRWHWFTWWFNHLPGPSISPKRTHRGHSISYCLSKASISPKRTPMIGVIPFLIPCLSHQRCHWDIVSHVSGELSKICRTCWGRP